MKLFDYGFELDDNGNPIGIQVGKNAALLEWSAKKEQHDFAVLAAKLMMRRRYLRLRSEALCVTCGHAAAPGKSRCEKHAAAASARNASRRKSCKLRYCCVSCSGPSRPNRTLCARCARKVKKPIRAADQCSRCGGPADRRELRTCNACGEHSRRQAKDRRSAMKLAGLCVRCGATANGSSRCESCKRARCKK